MDSLTNMYAASYPATPTAPQEEPWYMEPASLVSDGLSHIAKDMKGGFESAQATAGKLSSLLKANELAGFGSDFLNSEGARASQNYLELNVKAAYSGLAEGLADTLGKGLALVPAAVSGWNESQEAGPAGWASDATLKGAGHLAAASLGLAPSLADWAGGGMLSGGLHLAGKELEAAARAAVGDKSGLGEIDRMNDAGRFGSAIQATSGMTADALKGIWNVDPNIGHDLDARAARGDYGPFGQWVAGFSQSLNQVTRDPAQLFAGLY